MAAIPLRNRIRSVIGGVFRRPIIRAKDRFLNTAAISCRDTQQDTLQRLLHLNAGSRFSRDHGLQPGLSSAEFSRCVAISDYETFRPYIERMKTGDHAALLGHGNKLLMYATTSGTTSQPKLIPITNQFIQDYRRGWQFWGIAAQQTHHRLKQLRMVQITSHHQQTQTQDGTPCGNISGLVTAMQRRIVRKLYTVPAAVARINDPASKRYAVARFALADPWVGMLVTANPSTLLLLNSSATASATALIRDIHDGTLTANSIPQDVATELRRRLRPDIGRAAELERIVESHGYLDPRQCWTQLSVLGVWTGGSAGSYLPELRKRFGDIPIRDHGLHASEGRMTIPFSDNTAAGLLDIESHYFEFVPEAESDSEKPITLQAHELERDQDYYILLTTSSGLSRYNIRDVVRCTGYHGSTPLLEFRHKGAHVSSITGEKITESQVVDSVREAVKIQQAEVTQFTLTPAWGDPPQYNLYVHCGEATATPETLSRLATTADEQLRKHNCEYDEKRGTGRLAQLKCQSVSFSAWETFGQGRLKTSGGSPDQYKHPCLLPDAAFDNRFLKDSGLSGQAETSGE